MDLSSIQEKEMMGGLVFMYNEKMCVGVIKDELMCRIDPELVADAIEQRGCRQMDFTGRPMKSYIIIDESGMRTAKEFEYWISLALDFNSRAKSSKRKK
jgi:TfoX/Sxy family transcriptional regulator of competence genes